MNFPKIKWKNVSSLVISLLLAFMIFSIYKNTTVLTSLEDLSLNFRFYMRDTTQNPENIDLGVTMQTPNPLASDDIIILAIDEETIRYFGESNIHWPFPWHIYKTFNDFVDSGNPNTIVYDIMFLDHKPSEKMMANSFANSGKVIVDYPFEKTVYSKQNTDQAERLKALEKTALPNVVGNDTELFVEVIPPTSTISNSVMSMGFANVLPDQDKTTRKSTLIIKYKDRYYPSIVLSTVMSYYGITKDDVEVKIGDYIKLNNVDTSKLKKGNSGNTITIPINEYGQMATNYIGIHGSYNTIPFYYFYNDGTMEGNDSLKDKIVLVAAYSVQGIANDVEKSPFGEMFGIEHHTHAINTILNQDFLHNMSDTQLLILFIAIALILGVILSRLSIILSTILIVVLSLLYVFAAHFLFEHQNLIIAYSTPLIQIVINYILITTIRIFTEQNEKKYIRKTFSKFVSKSVVDELLKNPSMLKLGGEEKDITVLFSDIRGFTSISEQLTPEDLVLHLNDYLQAMTNIVIKYHGTLDKYIGDAIMAFWGAPLKQENHALLCCKAGLEMLESLDPLNEEWIAAGKPPLNIGIGINTGKMVAGNMGSNSRMDYTIMGDSVNLGSRVEGVNKQYKTRLIITEYTYEQVKEHVIVRELDLIRVKGKKQPVTIYELLDLK